MTNLRHNAKRDANEPDIVDALKAAGYRVYRVNGEGVPDLIVCRQGRPTIVLMEVKMADGDFRPAQARFWTETSGVLRFVVRTPEEAVKVAETWILLERSESLA